MKLWPKLTLIFLSSLLLGGCSLLTRKKMAALQVITDDIGAAIFLNDQHLDQAPVINKEIKPGTYRLKIEPDNPELAPYQTQVELRPNLLTVVTWRPGKRPETSGGVIYELEPIVGKKGELAFVTIPDNVLVKLDQRKQQFSPITFKEVEPGHHQFSLTLTAYEQQKHTINVPAGHRITVTAKLARSNPEMMQPQTGQPSSARSATIAAQLAADDQVTTTDASQSATVKIESTNFYQDGNEVLRVRQKAKVDSLQIGLAEVGQNYPYLGQTEQGWHQIQLATRSGWVSQDYATLQPSP